MERSRGLGPESGAQPSPVSFLGARGLVVAGGGIAILLILVTIANSLLGYVLYNVKSTEVGIQFRASKPFNVVGPGIYSDVTPFAEIVAINVQDLPFRMSDDEVLTKDKQRIGIVVAGTVRRPGLEKANVLLSLWASYSTFYLNDAALVGTPGTERTPGMPGLMQALGQQASKVCVGDLTFDEAVVGSARDVLRECIDKELDKLAAGYGLEVRNVVVPEVVLEKGVQEQLDQITAARFATQVALQREQQARAEAARELAVQQGQILVEQGRIQEKAKQDAITANLNRQALEAQNAVIAAEKRNALLAAEKDLEIAKVQRSVAEENARASLATELARAAMFQANPQYTDLQRVQALASAYKQTDKFIVLPAGTDPYVFIGGERVPVTVPASAPGAARP